MMRNGRIDSKAQPDEGRIFAVALDNTARGQADDPKAHLEMKVLQMQKMEAVGQLAGGVAHNFNNMLSVILGHVDLALTQLDTADPVCQDIQKIRQAAQRSAELTRQLLAFAGGQMILPKVLDLNAAVEDVLDRVRRVIGGGIDLIWKPAANLWTVKLDPAQLEQVLANLAANARDAIIGDGAITIETGNVTFDESYCQTHTGFQPGAYLRLAVSDNGCGMDAAVLQRLFEPFFTTKAVGKGTGLGLATIYGIVNKNNGFIHVHSEPGSGSVFTLYFPRHISGEAAPERNASLVETPSGAKTVLLVDDDPSLLNLLGIWLRKLGYTVLAAGNPTHAIQIAEKYPGPIDLLTTDMVMPEMNGRELGQRILTMRPRIKRLFMSGYAANVTAHHGVLDEGVPLLQKPCTRDMLALKVREALQH